MAKTSTVKKKAPAKAKKTAAKKAAKPVGPRPGAAMTVKHIAAELAAANEMPKKTVEGILTGMVESVVKNLKKGTKIRIVGLGMLQVRKRAARMGRNPATGEAIKIKASKKVAFRAAKELKASI
jgi:DNA-binding protein HU-beta